MSLMLPKGLILSRDMPRKLWNQAQGYNLINVTRIISGLASGATLKVPKAGTRPSSERVREALFSALESQDLLADAEVLDLYAGSGALAFEAVSRGARSADLVESNPSAVGIIKQNIAEISKRIADAEVHAYANKVLSFLTKKSSSPYPLWDLVFIDPPYEIEASEIFRLLQLLKPSLKDDATVVFERRSKSEHDFSGYEQIKTQSFGDTEIIWLVPDA